MKGELFEDIAADLVQVEATLLRIVSTQEQTLNNIGTHLLVAGGKRLRPGLFLLAAKLHKYNLPYLLPVATALELIHMATLVHDDVIDEAKTRRGYPTANAKWGNTTAVLAGDFLFAQAFSIISHMADSRISGTLSQIVSGMCEGEILQIINTTNIKQTEADYLTRIQKKTADFIAGACELGAYMSGAPDAVVKSMREYGHCIGMAFQITDDILDITAEAAQIGKPAGNDLKQGIMTLPIIYALHNSREKDELCAIIQREERQVQDINRGLDIIRATDAVEYACGLLRRYIQNAKDKIVLIDNLVLRRDFECVADFVSQRNY